MFRICVTFLFSFSISYRYTLTLTRQAHVMAEDFRRKENNTIDIGPELDGETDAFMSANNILAKQTLTKTTFMPA